MVSSDTFAVFGCTEMAKKMRKRFIKRRVKSPNARNDKALNNQGFVATNMAEALGFELMDLLQSTVFKTDIQMC